MFGIGDFSQFFLRNTIMPARGIAIIQSIATLVDSSATHTDQFLDSGVDPVAKPNLLIIGVESFKQFRAMCADTLCVRQ